MAFVFSIVVLGGLVRTAYLFWERLWEEDATCPSRGWFLKWAAQGAIAPVCFWLILNAGFFPNFPPLLPEIAFAQAGGGRWGEAFLTATSPGVLVISTFWSALTLAWLAMAIVPRATNRGDVIGLGLTWAALSMLIALPIALAFGLAGLGGALTVCLLPVTHFTLPLVMTKKHSPMYSRAVAKMKFGKYTEAEKEVLLELEQSQDDFEGWMMLAELYANHFGDLPGAAATINDLCAQPNITGSQLSVALQKLADWHLKLAEDPLGARAALQEICRRLPGTHLERMARQRLDQLPATREELHELRERRPIPLPAMSELTNETSGPFLSREEAVRVANRCVEKLQENPDHVSPREELARLFAENLGQLHFAREQIHLLLGMTQPSELKKAEWLGRLAVWELKYAADEVAARALFQRLVDQFPQTPQAFAAQRRLKLMETEEKLRRGQKATAPVKPTS